ncbi:MAG: hypothetical protein OXL95_01315 [Nitrospira sp.]|nr:hypothetical protein [Nitrospira sp.]
MAAKADIAAVRSDLANEFSALRFDITALETRLYRHLWIMAASIVGLTVALIKLIP